MDDIYDSISYLIFVYESPYFMHNFMTEGHYMCPMSDPVN